jgi:hypothetical protein
MTRYELFRRRIAPAMFLGVVALIAYDTCTKQERTQATFVIDFGEARAHVRSVDGELVVGGEVVGTLHCAALSGLQIGSCRFETSLPAESGELRLDVDLDGHHRTLVRRVHVVDGATVTVSLGRDLRPDLASGTR